MSSGMAQGYLYGVWMVLAFWAAKPTVDPSRKGRSPWGSEIRGGHLVLLYSFLGLVRGYLVTSISQPNIPFGATKQPSSQQSTEGCQGRFAGCIYLCGLIPRVPGVPRSPPKTPSHLTLGPEGAPTCLLHQAPPGMLLEYASGEERDKVREQPLTSPTPFWAPCVSEGGRAFSTTSLECSWWLPGVGSVSPGCFPGEVDASMR